MYTSAPRPSSQRRPVRLTESLWLSTGEMGAEWDLRRGRLLLVNGGSTGSDGAGGCSPPCCFCWWGL